MTYLCLMICSCLLLYYSEKCSLNLRKLFFFSSFLVVCVPAAIRYNIAYDYKEYVNIFYAIQTGQEVHVEPAFKLLNQTISDLGMDVQWVFALTSVVIYGSLYFAYPKQNAWLIHFFFMTLMYLESLNVIRTFIVLAFSFLAIKNYSLNGKKIAYIILLFIASAFHKTALLLVPFVFFDNSIAKKIFERKIFLTFAFLVGVFVFKKDIASVLLNNYFSDLLGYDFYNTNDYYQEDQKLQTGFGLVFKGLLLFVPLYYSKDLLKINEKYVVVLSLFVACATALILSTTYVIFIRVHYIFLFCYIMSPYLLLEIQRSKNSTRLKVVIYALMFISLVVFIKDIVQNQSDQCESSRVSPYVSIFNKEDDKSIDLDIQICR